MVNVFDIGFSFYILSTRLYILIENSNEGESVDPRDISIERFQEGCVLARGVSRGHETRDTMERRFL